MDAEELATRFTYHTPKDNQQVEKYVRVRGEALDLAAVIDELCPESREKSFAFTKLEEAIMWANASIARRE